MFTKSRNISAYPPKGLCPSHIPETARDLLLYLVYSQIPLSLIIVEWNTEVVYKHKHFRFVLLEPVQKIAGRMFF